MHSPVTVILVVDQATIGQHDPRHAFVLLAELGIVDVIPEVLAGFEVSPLTKPLTLLL